MPQAFLIISLPKKARTISAKAARYAQPRAQEAASDCYARPLKASVTSLCIAHSLC